MTLGPPRDPGAMADDGPGPGSVQGSELGVVSVSLAQSCGHTRQARSVHSAREKATARLVQCTPCWRKLKRTVASHSLPEPRSHWVSIFFSLQDFPFTRSGASKVTSAVGHVPSRGSSGEVTLRAGHGPAGSSSLEGPFQERVAVQRRHPQGHELACGGRCAFSADVRRRQV